MAWLACLSLAHPAAFAQPSAPTPLPPAAQEALNKGLIAAKMPDYLLAIRYFEEARKIAPEAPITYLNLGLAEARMAGRELRAMAWFGAYLAAYPTAPNAAAVKEQIAVLDVKNQSNISQLIKSVEGAANQISDNAPKLANVAALWAEVGDITAALKTADRIPEGSTWKISAQTTIVRHQIDAGDIVGAQRHALLIQHADTKRWALLQIAQAQARNGDILGAQKTVVEAQRAADIIQKVEDKSNAQSDIATTQANINDIAGARKTAELIHDPYYECFALLQIAQAQAKGDDIVGAKETFTEAQKIGDLIQAECTGMDRRRA